MEYDIQKADELIILSLRGRLLGEHQTIGISEEIDEQISLGVINIIVDLTALEFINSTGLNFLLTLLTKVRKADGEVVLCNMNTLLRTLMITTKLNSFFTITDDMNNARAHFNLKPIV
ncbi:MAG: anti-sigma B factor antagonist [Limisphaerales bacterium]|jgi:anti-sigma B factor antagonist